MDSGALASLKVVEWAEFVSGPYCGKLLADLGADVIKVEKPGCGDRARSYGPFPNDIPHPEKSGVFLYFNTNKRSVTLDVATATGADIFRKLVKWADVLVENHPPQMVHDLGLGYDTLKDVNPGLVMTSITPYGQTGPYRDYRACDMNVFHASGMAFINPSDGVDDAETKAPLKEPEHQADLAAGLSAGVATMSAVLAAKATGTGHHVDVSQQEALASIMRREYAVCTMEGLTWVRPKDGRTGLTVSDIYQCRDGRVYLICFQDRMWEGWLDVMGYPEWATTDLFSDRITRRENWDAAKVMIEEWTMERTVKEIVEMADSQRVPCKAVNTVEDVVGSELLASRDFFEEVNHKEAGTVTYPGAPYKLSATPWRIARPAPLLGEHNGEVYCDMLGYTGQDVKRLRAEGIV